MAPRVRAGNASEVPTIRTLADRSSCLKLWRESKSELRERRPAGGAAYLPQTSAVPVDDRRVRDESDVLILTACVLQRRS